MSITSLSLDKDLCRCCHAEGSFDDLAQPYCHDGKEEAYSDIIKDSFNIEVRPVPGQLCVVTYKICNMCIQRLQDAFLFKKQVQNCEVIFMDLYNKSCSEIKGRILNSVVKEEFSDSEDIKEDYSSINTYDDDDDDDIDDEDFVIKMPVIEEESCTTKRSTKKAKSKSKLAKEPKPKKRREVKTQKIKEEERKEDDAAEGSEPKKRKGVDDSDTFVLTEAADGSSVYSCNMCVRTFKKRDLFSQHYRHVHLKLRPKFRGCYLCKEKVPSHLQPFHMEDAHGYPAPTCGACGKRFAFPSQVLQHQKDFHMGEKAYECATCGLKCSTKSKLRRHLDAHSSSRPFKCFCDAAFKWKKNLQTHIFTHLDERMHACDTCQMAFVQQSSLKYHMRKYHPEVV